MANNRMFIECSCGKEMMIAKHFGTPWTIRADKEQMDKFLEKHFNCTLLKDGSGIQPLAQGSHFKLKYEHTDDRPEEVKLG